MRFFAICLCLFSAFSWAQVNKCVEDGRVVFSDKLCRAGAEQARPTAEEMNRLSRAKKQASGSTDTDEKARQAIQAEFDQYAKPVEERRNKEADECKAWMAEPPKVVNSAWDGGVATAERYLKSVLRDPDSLVTETWGRVQKVCSGYTVSVSYRAKNGFGGYGRSVARIYLTKDGVAYKHD